jgi:hypothetical protein
MVTNPDVDVLEYENTARKTGVIPPRGRAREEATRRGDDALRAKVAWLVVGSDMELGKEDVSRISDTVFSAYAACHLCYVSRVIV